MQSTVDALGWDDRLEEAFSEYAASGLAPARVVAQHRGVCIVSGDDGEAPAVVRGRLSDQSLLAGGLPAVGDWVALRRRPDSTPVIEAVLPRCSCVTRKKAWQEADEQVLVANVDTLLLVSDLVGDFNVRRLERYVAVAYESGAAPVVVLTKLDLRRDPERLLAAEEVAIGLPVLAVSNVTGEGLDELERHLVPRRTVALIGSSGVGKSTLINRLAGAELMPTREVRDDGRGRHTTRHRQLLVLPGGALLVDTPGLRELQLWEGDLDGAFADVLGLAEGCRFSDCAHESEPGCAVHAAIASGELDPARLASYRKLERELASIEARRSRRVWAERKRRWKQRSREARRTRRYGA
jgi:ribosome biogenesis GTPase